MIVQTPLTRSARRAARLQLGLPGIAPQATPPRPAPAPRVIDTRRAALEAIESITGRLQQVVLDHLRASGPRGSTDEETAQACFLRPDSSRARRCELRDAGGIVDSGERRPTASGRLATVWVLSELAAPPAQDAPPPAASTAEHAAAN